MRFEANVTTDVPGLVRAAGGEVVGKVRLQKLVYLLEQLGLISGYSFEYRHYGPYSEELADQVEDDVVFGRLTASIVVGLRTGSLSGLPNGAAWQKIRDRELRIRTSLKHWLKCRPSRRLFLNSLRRIIGWRQ